MTDPRCLICGCPESLHGFSGKCSGGRCMCPGLALDEDDEESVEGAI